MFGLGRVQKQIRRAFTPIQAAPIALLSLRCGATRTCAVSTPSSVSTDGAVCRVAKRV